MLLREIVKSNEVIGYQFKCPGCGGEHSVSIHPHYNQDGSSWHFDGNLYAPTFSPSILERTRFTGDRADRVCHSYVTGGEIRFLTDCTHELAGLTVSLGDFEDD